MHNQIEINGIVLSDQAQKVLKKWQNSESFSTPSDPELYVEYLNDTQDCLTRVMLESASDMPYIADILTKLICIKDDLKLLITRKENIS
jgi:hypothetical protein